MSDSSYWREQYRAEADENHRIRQALGVEPTDPDETLTARTVSKKLRDEYKRGYETGKRHKNEQIVELLKSVLEADDVRGELQKLVNRATSTV